MKPIHFIEIALRIILIVAVGMVFTYFTEPLREFFGDVKCIHYHGYYNIESKTIGTGDIDKGLSLGSETLLVFRWMHTIVMPCHCEFYSEAS